MRMYSLLAEFWKRFQHQLNMAFRVGLIMRLFSERIHKSMQQEYSVADIIWFKISV
jgi:hypothetical protein